MKNRSKQERMKALMVKAENRVCIDCSERSDHDPEYATIILPKSTDPWPLLGAFCCYQCCMLHFRLGDEICHVKNLENIDDLGDEDIISFESGGNKKVNQLFEATLKGRPNEALIKPHFRSDEEVKFIFVRDKYEFRRYYSDKQFHSLDPRPSVRTINLLEQLVREDLPYRSLNGTTRRERTCRAEMMQQYRGHQSCSAAELRKEIIAATLEEGESEEKAKPPTRTSSKDSTKNVSVATLATASTTPSRSTPSRSEVLQQSRGAAEMMERIRAAATPTPHEPKPTASDVLFRGWNNDSGNEEFVPFRGWNNDVSPPEDNRFHLLQQFRSHQSLNSAELKKRISKAQEEKHKVATSDNTVSRHEERGCGNSISGMKSLLARQASLSKLGKVLAKTGSGNIGSTGDGEEAETVTEKEKPTGSSAGGGMMSRLARQASNSKLGRTVISNDPSSISRPTALRSREDNLTKSFQNAAKVGTGLSEGGAVTQSARQTSMPGESLSDTLEAGSSEMSTDNTTQAAVGNAPAIGNAKGQGKPNDGVTNPMAMHGATSVVVKVTSTNGGISNILNMRYPTSVNMSTQDMLNMRRPANPNMSTQDVLRASNQTDAGSPPNAAVKEQVLATKRSGESGDDMLISESPEFHLLHKVVDDDLTQSVANIERFAQSCGSLGLTFDYDHDDQNGHVKDDSNGHDEIGNREDTTSDGNTGPVVRPSLHSERRRNILGQQGVAQSLKKLRGFGDDKDRRQRLLAAHHRSGAIKDADIDNHRSNDSQPLRPRPDMRKTKSNRDITCRDSRTEFRSKQNVPGDEKDQGLSCQVLPPRRVSADDARPRFASQRPQSSKQLEQIRESSSSASIGDSADNVTPREASQQAVEEQLFLTKGISSSRNLMTEKSSATNQPPSRPRPSLLDLVAQDWAIEGESPDRRSRSSRNLVVESNTGGKSDRRSQSSKNLFGAEENPNIGCFPNRRNRSQRQLVDGSDKPAAGKPRSSRNLLDSENATDEAGAGHFGLVNPVRLRRGLRDLLANDDDATALPGNNKSGDGVATRRSALLPRSRSQQNLLAGADDFRMKRGGTPRRSRSSRNLLAGDDDSPKRPSKAGGGWNRNVLAGEEANVTQIPGAPSLRRLLAGEDDNKTPVIPRRSPANPKRSLSSEDAMAGEASPRRSRSCRNLMAGPGNSSDNAPVFPRRTASPTRKQGLVAGDQPRRSRSSRNLLGDSSSKSNKGSASPRKTRSSRHLLGGEESRVSAKKSPVRRNRSSRDLWAGDRSSCKSPVRKSRSSRKLLAGDEPAAADGTSHSRWLQTA